MNILWIDWNSFGKEDIISVFREMGHRIVRMPMEAGNYRLDPRYKHAVKERIKKEDCDLVFSSNYFPVVSDACKDTKIPYVAWCYDSPMILLYHKSIVNPCNYIFVFDSAQYFALRGKGVNTVYYMPMAVNGTRLQKLVGEPWKAHGNTLSQADIRKYGADVSFVGAMYNEKHNLYDRMAENLDAYTKAYLEGVMAAQRLVYGQFFLEEVLDDSIIETMQNALRFETTKDGFETEQYVYANYFLCRKMAELDRHEILEKISTHGIRQGAMANRNLTADIGDTGQMSNVGAKKAYQVKLYTGKETPELPYVTQMGPVDYTYEMPKVFAASKVNLNITLRSIVSGIPLRAMDIMGAGGFLLTNYQEDFLRHFVPGEDFVFYESVEDLQDKLAYYLQHDKERKEIAANGCKKVRAEHTYQKRLEEMLAIVDEGEREKKSLQL